MADAADIRRIARKNFEEAHANLDRDLADARTPQQARALMDNHDAALAQYLASISAALECAAGGWENALAEAEHAHAAVLLARQKAEALVDRIKAMTSLTASIARLIEAAA